MKLPPRHRVGRVLFNTTFFFFLSGVTAMMILAVTMCGGGAWAETIAAVLAIPVFTRLCSDMADYAMSLMLD
jgi:hypothetical protein